MLIKNSFQEQNELISIFARKVLYVQENNEVGAVARCGCGGGGLWWGRGRPLNRCPRSAKSVSFQVV
jgi:hypothetical protein